MDIKELANIVDQAALNAKPVAQLSKNHTFNEQEAYAIQAASIDRRYARGEKFIGLKMGFTSIAKMEQMGVHDMIWGRLTDKMYFENGGQLPFEKFIHPRAEPEICFLVNRKIDRELALDECRDYVKGIAAAIEIIDSRYEQFKFSLEDVIADNCSSSGLVIGDWCDPDIAIDDLKMILEIDGQIVQEGSSAAILGDPWKSFQAATRLAAFYGQEIPVGSFIMAGAATPAVYLKKGQEVQVRVEQLGKAELSVV